MDKFWRKFQTARTPLRSNTWRCAQQLLAELNQGRTEVCARLPVKRGELKFFEYYSSKMMFKTDEDEPLRSHQGELFERLKFTLAQKKPTKKQQHVFHIFGADLGPIKLLIIVKSPEVWGPSSAHLCVMGGFRKDRKYTKSSTHSSLVFLFLLYLKVIEWHAQKCFYVSSSAFFQCQSCVWELCVDSIPIPQKWSCDWWLNFF